MHKKPKSENVSEETCEPDDKSVWSEDQKKKSYYYDDSYGYKVYNPDEDDEDNEDDDNETGKNDFVNSK